MRELKALTKYRHFKGREYLVLCKSTPIEFDKFMHSTLNIKCLYALHTETKTQIESFEFLNGEYHHLKNDEDLVIYMALYGNFQVHARPYDMFMSKVDKIKYPDSKQEYRFEEID